MRTGVPRCRGSDFNWPTGAPLVRCTNTMLHQLAATIIDEEKYKATIEYVGRRAEASIIPEDRANKIGSGGRSTPTSRTEFLGGRLATDRKLGNLGILYMVAAKSIVSACLPRFPGALFGDCVDADCIT